MNEIGEEIKEVVETLRLMAQAMSPDGDEEFVPQFVPTKHELMTLVAHYLDLSYQMRSMNDGKPIGVDYADSRGSGILCLLRLLYGDDEVEDLERRFLSPVHSFWRNGGCPYRRVHDGKPQPHHTH